MKVLVIPEDFRKDQYILKPLVQALVEAAEGTTVRVRVCQDPLIGGITEALKWERIQEVLDRCRGMFDLYLLIVDRDGNAQRRQVLDVLEKRARTVLSAGRVLLAENAWQELEVWVLAGHDLPATWKWAEIRRERDPKEQYFRPFAKGREDEPGEGRKTLALEAAARYPQIRAKCTEDVEALEVRIRAFLTNN